MRIILPLVTALLLLLAPSAVAAGAETAPECTGVETEFSCTGMDDECIGHHVYAFFEHCFGVERGSLA